MLYSGNFDSNKSPPVSLGTRKHTHTQVFIHPHTHTTIIYTYPHTYMYTHNSITCTWLSMYIHMASTCEYSTVHALLSLVSRPIQKIGLGKRLMHYYVLKCWHHYTWLITRCIHTVQMCQYPTFVTPLPSLPGLPSPPPHTF